MLKQAFTYARQQAWGSPNVLQLVDRCNKAGVVENWCMVGNFIFFLRELLSLVHATKHFVNLCNNDCIHHSRKFDI